MDDRTDQIVDVIDAAVQMVAANRQLSAETTEFIEQLKQVLNEHGVATTKACLKLVPIAQAKGDSKAEVDLMIDRFDRGLLANAFVSLNPGNTRFPCEVVGTGRIGPHGLDVPQAHRQTG